MKHCTITIEIDGEDFANDMAIHQYFNDSVINFGEIFGEVIDYNIDVYIYDDNMEDEYYEDCLEDYELEMRDRGDECTCDNCKCGEKDSETTGD